MNNAYSIYTVEMTLLLGIDRLLENELHPFSKWYRDLKWKDGELLPRTPDTEHVFLNGLVPALREVSVMLNGIERTVLCATGYSEVMPVADKPWPFVLGHHDPALKTDYDIDYRRMMRTSRVHDVRLVGGRLCPLHRTTIYPELLSKVENSHAHIHISTRNTDYCLLMRNETG